jgi:hypothetical protein
VNSKLFKKKQMTKSKKTEPIKVLNIGCGHAPVPLPGVKEVRLDADPKVKPDIVLDIRKLKTLPKHSYEGVWCSHVLEHFYEHELPMILDGIRHVLKADGVLFAMVPDLRAIFIETIQRNLGINDVLYVSGMGPVRARDVLYGFQPEVATGNIFYSHKTGFDAKIFRKTLEMAGFQKVFIGEENLQINAIACRSKLPKWASQFVKAK